MKSTLAAMMILAGSMAAVSAQDAPAATDAPVAETQAETAPEDRFGETYIREEFTDWELRCILLEDQIDPCQLYQLLRDQDGNAVAEISLFALPGGGRAIAGATITTPLETLLTEDILLSVDDGEGKRYPFSFCSEIGCFSRVGFTAEEVEGFRRGAEAVLVIVPAAAPDAEVRLTISLAGFTAGFGALDALVNPQ